MRDNATEAGPDLSGGRLRGERRKPQTLEELEHGREGVQLPQKQFLYTLDQVALLLAMSEDTLRLRYLWYQGLSVGVWKKDRLKAVDIAPVGDKRGEWRVSEEELIRWLRHKRLRIY